MQSNAIYSVDTEYSPSLREYTYGHVPIRCVLYVELVLLAATTAINTTLRMYVPN